MNQPFALPDIGFSRDGTPGSELTTFRIGGKIRYVREPESASELICLYHAARSANIPARVVGNGSNLLAPDSGINGLWILTKRQNKIRITPPYIRADCGASLSAMIRQAADVSLGGMENLYGIPGTVGGACVMNAGAYGAQFSDMLLSVTALDTASGDILEIPAHACGFGYRTSVFQNGTFVVLSCTFRLSPSRPDLIRSRADWIVHERTAKQPLSYPNAGSIFKRPENAYAGKLIRDAGCGGLRVGQACVSEKHAGFIVNLGGATSEDVLQLIAIVRKRVYCHSGITLEQELITIEEQGV